MPPEADAPPGLEPRAQRFRAPDLVWHELEATGDSWGFIVLLSSGYSVAPIPGSVEECPKTEDGEPLRWCFRWLQRFTLDGKLSRRRVDPQEAFVLPLPEGW